MIDLLNIDCMEYMSTQPDDAFDLAIVDPPFGIGEFWKPERSDKAHKNTCGKSHAKWNEKIPSSEYFNELFRVSKKQIIWGGNYYTEYLSPTNSWIFWDKKISEKTRQSQGELAWTSFNHAMRTVEITWNGFCRSEPRAGFHPCEKPIGLYRWILENYAQPGQKILDTHLGSGSSAIAAHYFGVDFVGCEIDQAYYKKALNRFHDETAQFDLVAKL